MSNPRNAPLPVAPPTTPPPLGTRMLGFFLLGGTMWIAGLLALIRAIMSFGPP